MTPRFQEALRFCVEVHGKDRRKGKETPYLAHLLSVCALVLEDGGDEDEAIGALLHDALEDHPETVSPDDLRGRFGERVLSLVVACSDTPPDYEGGRKPPWKERKQGYLDHLRRSDLGALRIALADKVHNLRDLLADLRAQGESVWDRFNAGKPDQLWFYRSLATVFRRPGLRAS